MDEAVDRRDIREREARLRAWFTRNCDPVQGVVDGLDIGWGGVQGWATARMPPVVGVHLDMACGYATFLAQLGWRFPEARLVGLNIDFKGPHALAQPLLREAGVAAPLVQADARRMPFADDTFGSVSCFLGLQDVEIGFGLEGVRAAVTEAVRVLQPGGGLTLLDRYPAEQTERLMEGEPVEPVDAGECALDVRWDRRVAERAVALYAEGYAAQARPSGPAERERIYRQVYGQMVAQMEHQLGTQGYYVPFGPVQMIVVRKTGQGRAHGGPGTESGQPG
jgi:SAM-dependent methyltransferase